MAQTDTLDGLSIRYNISKDLIRKTNDFSGDEIYMMKELIIPESGKLFVIISFRWAYLQNTCESSHYRRPKKTRSYRQIEHESLAEIQIPAAILC